MSVTGNCGTGHDLLAHNPTRYIDILNEPWHLPLNISALGHHRTRSSSNLPRNESSHRNVDPITKR
jgi:hypothetical protein